MDPILYKVSDRSTGIPGIPGARHRSGYPRAWVLLLALALGCATPWRPEGERAEEALPGRGSGEQASPLPASEPPPASPADGGAARVVLATTGAAGSARPPLRPVAATPPGVRTTARVTIGAVGDVLMHGAVVDAAADHRTPDNDEGYAWLWSPVADLLADADLTFANLETPVAPRAGQATRSFVFNAGPPVVRALQHAGIDLLSVANNHIFDQGRAGFEETVARLDAMGMGYVGAGPAEREAGPRTFEVNGLRIAFLGYSRFFNQSGNECPTPTRRAAKTCLKASELDPDRAVADVRAAAAAADAVVVSLHWGDEYRTQPRRADVALAHRLADAGALLVLGHHPHVLQPIELYMRPDGSTALIAYSLGNFISNQSRLYVQGVTPERVATARDGAILRVEIARRDYGRGVSRIELGSAGWLPLWTQNDTTDAGRRAAGRRPSIRVVSVDRALAEVRAELAALPEPVPAAQQGRYVSLRRAEELYVARRAAIAAALGEDLEIEPPPSARNAARAAVTPAASP